MQIRILPSAEFSAALDLEIVERKGLGHPDTLADFVAEEFSGRYSRYSLERFGTIANHAVDKVTLLGAKARVAFGTATLESPIRACLFGKTTRRIADHELPIAALFQETVDHVFLRVFGTEEILRHISCVVDTHDGIGFDHPQGFYGPASVAELTDLFSALTSNDTVSAVAHAPYTSLELAAILVENYVNSPEFKQKFPETGFDVKVLAIRIGESVLDITVCIPFVAALTPSMSFYRERLAAIRAELTPKITEWVSSDKLVLNLNTKDADGRYAYLTAFGSALDKGDQGAVGRGNRYHGVISSTRAMSVEAPAGKNPVHHAGKLYNAAAHRIAHDIYNLTGAENSVFITAKNGDPLAEPSFVTIKVAHSFPGLDSGYLKEVEGIVSEVLGDLTALTTRIVSSDPVEEHIHRAFDARSGA